MERRASDLARRLGDSAEAGCRHYLPAGRRQGGYWRVGDVANRPGESLFVALRPPRAGRWTDAATGEYGDLLDLIRARLSLSVPEAIREAERFLGATPVAPIAPKAPARDAGEAARRLFAAGRALSGSPAELYLRRRGLVTLGGPRWLRSHPRCYRLVGAQRSAWPALLAGVTDLAGQVQGLQRVWLTPSGDKAPVPDPRRALGRLLGHAVRFGQASEVLAAGEGLESVLSLREVLPRLPAAAALSAAHLGAMAIPAGVRRLYMAIDNDAAGRRAGEGSRSGPGSRAPRRYD